MSGIDSLGLVPVYAADLAAAALAYKKEVLATWHEQRDAAVLQNMQSYDNWLGRLTLRLGWRKPVTRESALAKLAGCGVLSGEPGRHLYHWASVRRDTGMRTARAVERMVQTAKDGVVYLGADLNDTLAPYWPAKPGVRGA